MKPMSSLALLNKMILLNLVIRKWMNQKKIFYENVIPSINNKTVDIKFKDSNDLILDEKKYWK